MRPPSYAGLPVPTLLLVAGAAVGIVLAAISRVLVGIGARARARTAEKRLRQSIAEVSEKLVIHPVDAELQAYTRARDGLTRAMG